MTEYRVMIGDKLLDESIDDVLAIVAMADTELSQRELFATVEKMIQHPQATLDVMVVVAYALTIAVFNADQLAEHPDIETRLARLRAALTAVEISAAGL